MPRRLTAKQQRFVAAYDGNATQAAADAGYAGNRKTLEAVGRQNLAIPRIASAIAAREAKRERKDIATREARQAFWTRVMRGDVQDEQSVGGGVVQVAAKLSDRLKASELLGRSEADFTDKIAGPGAGGEHVLRFVMQWGNNG